MTVINEDFLEIVRKCWAGQYKLPAFQRSFKWKPKNVMLLFDSLRQNFPIGSFLMMKGDGPINFSPRSFEFSSSLSEKEGHDHLILDGQQRITSGIILFYGEAYDKYFIDILRVQELIKERNINIENPSHVKQFTSDLQINDKYIVRIRTKDANAELLKSHKFPTNLLWKKNTIDDDEYRVMKKRYLHQHSEFRDLFEAVIEPNFKLSPTGLVPSIVIDGNNSLQSITRIFQTLNTTGKTLNPFELVAAVLFSYDIKLSDEISSFKGEHIFYKNMDKDGEVLLQTIALLAGMTSKKSLLPQTITSELFKTHSKEAADALDDLGRFLTTRLGVGLSKSDELVIYPAMYAPMAIVMNEIRKDKRGIDTSEAERKIEKWFVGSLLSKRYQISTYERQKADKKDMTDWVKSRIEEPEWLKETRVPRLTRTRGSNAVGILIKCLINRKSPQDPVGGDKVGVSSEAVTTEIHHLFPKKLSARLKIKANELDCILNLIFISQRTNKEISDKDPREQRVRWGTRGDKYLERQFIDKKCLEIFDKREKQYKDYNDFLNLREKLLVKEFVEVWGFEPSSKEDDIEIENDYGETF